MFKFNLTIAVGYNKDKDNNNSATSQKVDINSPVVQTQLSITAGIVNRLANNCNTCKSVAAVLVGAFMAISNDVQGWKTFILWGMLFGVIAFQDAMYLAMKKNLEHDQKDFIRKVKEKEAVNVLELEKQQNLTVCALVAMGSRSIWPFYLICLAILAGYCFWI